MLTTSDAYKAAVNSTAREWAIRLNVTTDGENSFSFTQDDIVINSCTFTESSICGDGIQVGSTYANSLDFALINAAIYNNENFQNARVVCEFGIKTATGEYYYVPMGTFNVTQCDKKSGTIEIKTLDDMYRLMRPISAMSVVPENAAVLAAAAANLCGITVDSSFLSELGTISCSTSGLIDGDCTCRDFFSYAAAMLGKNVRFNRSGILESYFYGPSTYQTDPFIRLDGMNLNDMSVQVTKVTVKDRYGNKYSMPDDSAQDAYEVVMDSNPLIETKEQAEAALSAAHQSLCDTNVIYRPYECPYIGDPSVQAGDYVSHTLPLYDTPVRSVITKHVIKFAGSGTLYAEGETKETSRQKTALAKKLSETRIAAAKDLNDAVFGIEKDLENQTSLISNSLGFYTLIEKDASSGAITKFWLMDKKDAESATIIWKFTSGGMQVSHDHGQTFTSGWSADDTIIAHIISADLVKTGVLRAQDNTLEIDLGNGTFKASTQTGSTGIVGQTITLTCKEGEDAADVSQIKISADTDLTDDIVDMRMAFASLDGNSAVQSSIYQRFKNNNGSATEIEPLTIESALPIKIKSRLNVEDALVYDKILMQRKSSESGNTGVDFVLMEG